MRPQTLEYLKKLEAFRARPYRVFGGNLTIGYGREQDVQPGDFTTPENEHFWLVNYVANLERQIDRLVEPPLLGHQLEALTLLVYNIGLGAFTESTLLKRLNANDHEAVDYQWMRWVHDGGEMRDGLVIRRSRELCLWRWDVLA